jgi:sRNA-binding regulator protein Hfq
MNEDNILLNKICKLTYQNGFILDGKVVNVTNYGVMFKTPQKTSFIAWQNIREIILLEGDF